MLEPEEIDGLPFAILYIVQSTYLMENDDGEVFTLHKSTGVPSLMPIGDEEIYEKAFEYDADSLQFAGEGSRGIPRSVLESQITRILIRGT